MTIRLAQSPARVPNPVGSPHHCCDRVWADDAAQASPHDRGLITPMASLRAGAAAGATAMTGLVVGMTGGTGF